MELSLPDNKIVYLADDDSDFLNLVEKVLADCDIDIYCFSNGRELLNKVNQTKPHAILLDINMPILNGFDTIRELKRHDSTKEIPVLFISGSIDDFNVYSAFKLGAIDFIKKPFGTREIICRLSSAISVAQNMALIVSKQNELSRFNKAMIDREFRIIELKQEVNDLLVNQGASEKYTIRK